MNRTITNALKTLGLTPTGPAPICDERGRTLDWVRGNFRDVSGVYIILAASSMDPLYVGESHSNQLAETLLRHFRAWKIDARNDPKGRRRGGTTYARRGVVVIMAETPAQDAAAYQDALIDATKPRDNVIIPDTDAEADAIPI
jgi:hypothetical protein